MGKHEGVNNRPFISGIVCDEFQIPFISSYSASLAEGNGFDFGKLYV